MTRLLVALLASTALAGTAHAGCQVANATGENFTLESSGGASNVRLAARTDGVGLPSGRLYGVSDRGQTVSGTCSDGARLRIVEENGRVFLVER